MVSDEISSKFSEFYFHLTTMKFGLEDGLWSKKYGKENRSSIRTFLMKKFGKSWDNDPPVLYLLKSYVI